MALTVFWGRPSNILCAGTPEQRERWLLPCVRGEKVDALAMTEPDAGSDLRGMSCSARRDGGDWVINGTKHFISHADVADFVILFVATGEDGPGRKRISCLLVDRGTPGFGIHPGYNSVSPSRLPQLDPDLRRLPGAGGPDAGRGGAGLRPGQHLAARHPPDRGGDVRRPRPPRLRPGADLRRPAQAVRPADRPLPGHRLQAGRHDHRDRRRRLADPVRRLAASTRGRTPTARSARPSSTPRRCWAG